MITLPRPVIFQWDKGNIDKNWIKHKVTNKECEETFFDKNKKIAKDKFHFKKEDRYILLGKTKKGRILYIVFTIRNKTVRVISLGDINRRRGNYMKKSLKLPKFKNEDEEREFWSKVNLADYFEPKDFVSASFPNLKPTTRAISIRLPEYLIDRIKEQANEINVPYQSLIKGYLKKAVFG